MENNSVTAYFLNPVVSELIARKKPVKVENGKQLRKGQMVLFGPVMRRELMKNIVMTGEVSTIKIKGILG